MNDVQEVCDFLTSIPAWYLATSDEADPTQPRVRPFSFAAVQDGKLWFSTSRDKDVWRELSANPKFEAFGLEAGPLLDRGVGHGEFVRCRSGQRRHASGGLRAHGGAARASRFPR